MPYIGKSPTGTGVRSRYYFTASGGETSLSGASDSGATLSFTDGNYVDVSLNGVALVAGTDYNTTTANTIGGLTALSASDIVEILVYDIFTVADTVPASSGGTFSGGVTMGSTLAVTGASTATGGLNVGTIKDAGNNATAMTIDSDGVVKITQNPCFFITGNFGGYINTSPVVFAIVKIDTRNGVDLTNNKYVVPVAGKWHFHIQLGIVGVTAGGACYPIIRKTPVGGGAVTDHGYSYYSPINAAGVTSYSHLDVDAIVDCDVGDSFNVPFVQTAATYYNGTNECRFFGYFLG